MDLLASSLARSPELFPLDFDPATNRINLVRLTEADYRRASFLDARILAPQTLRRTVFRAQLEAGVEAAGITEAASYVFHTGHVGSTLLSRLLGAHPLVFALREPAILRTLAQIRSRSGAPPGWAGQEFDDRLGAILKLLGRTFRPDQRALIKATSFVSELAAEILVRPSQPRAILMYVPAETYLATILGAPNSPREARMLAQSRIERLNARAGEEHWKLAGLSEGEMVAMSWACEMGALAAAAEAAPTRALWLNFTSFLENSAASLVSIFRHLGIEAAPEEIDSIASGPDLQRYAKAPEHAYSASLREEILDQARKQRADEIGRGLAWLERAARQSRAIASAMNMP